MGSSGLWTDWREQRKLSGAALSLTCIGIGIGIARSSTGMYRTALRAFHMPNFCTFLIIALNMNVANGGISLIGLVSWGGFRLWVLLLMGVVACGV